MKDKQVNKETWMQGIPYFSTSLLLTFLLPVFAAEHEVHKHGLWHVLVQSNLLNVLILALALVYLGNKFLPKIIDERKKQISQELENAKQTRLKAEEELATAKKNTENIYLEIETIKKEGIRNAEIIKEQMQKDTKKELEDLNHRIQREVHSSYEEAVQEIKRSTSNAAMKLAEEALVKLSSTSDIQKKLQEDFLKELNKTAKGNRN